MDFRTLKDTLSRAKLYATRGNFTQSIGFLLKCLQAIHKTPSISSAEARTAVREILHVYTKDPFIRPMLTPFIETITGYEGGKERAVFTVLKPIFDTISKQAEEESYEAAMARKIHLDKALGRAKRSLEDGHLPKAEESFKEACSFYKDEYAFFLYIAKLYMESKQYTLAQSYLKRELEVNSDSEDAQKLMQQVSKLL